MKTVLLNRFVVRIDVSFPELWWVEVADGSKHWNLFGLSIVERSFEERRYRGLQFIFLGLIVCVGDRKSFCRKYHEN